MNADPFRCGFCGETTNPRSPNTLRRVSGWERPRSQGGANAIVARKVLDEWAHDGCVRAAGSPDAGEQGSLL